MKIGPVDFENSVLKKIVFKNKKQQHFISQTLRAASGQTKTYVF